MLKSRRLVRFMALAMLLSLVMIASLTIVAYAQGADEAPAEGSTAPAEDIGSFWWLIKSGGIPEIILFAFSIAGITLAIEDFVSLRMTKLVPPATLDDLEASIEDGAYDEAIEICESDDCFLTRVLHPVLLRSDTGDYEYMKETLEESGDVEATKLHQKIGWLSLIAALGPMVGLLGTVMGMLSAFMVMAKNPDQANPGTLAGGISGALVTTVTGLFVAIPMLFFYYFFRNRVVRVVQEVAKISGQILERFKTQK